MTPKGRLRLLAEVGADRYATRGEIRWPSPRGEAWIDDVWRVYEEHFDGFTGARLDPGFERFSHPGSYWGTLRMDRGATVIVTGTGPSLAGQAAALRGIRNRVLVFTSARGAAALRDVGVIPDLIVVEHASALDAHLSLEFAANATIPDGAWVAAELRTPREALAGVDTDRLFVPHEWPGWGCWPATAVAMALGAGAGRVGLLGVDLGTSNGVAPEFAPLTALLGLLARTGLATCVDFGAGSAPKPGWECQALGDVIIGVPTAPIRVDARAFGHGAFVDEAAQWRLDADTVLRAARQALEAALAARDGAGHGPAEEAARLLLSWGADAALRTGMQDVLGVTFLPRLWKGSIDLSHRERLWRPVVLGLHELVAQADRLDALLARYASSRARCA